MQTKKKGRSVFSLLKDTITLKCSIVTSKLDFLYRLSLGIKFEIFYNKVQELTYLSFWTSNVRFYFSCAIRFRINCTIYNKPQHFNVCICLTLHFVNFHAHTCPFLEKFMQDVLVKPLLLDKYNACTNYCF